MISYQNRTGLKLRVLSPINFTACGSFCLTAVHPFVYMLRTHFQIDFFCSCNWLKEDAGIRTKKKKQRKKKWYSIMSFSLHFLTPMCVCIVSVYPDCMLYQHTITRSWGPFSLHRHNFPIRVFCPLAFDTGMRVRWLERRFIKFILSLSVSTESLESLWRGNRVYHSSPYYSKFQGDDDIFFYYNFFPFLVFLGRRCCFVVQYSKKEGL